MSAELNFWIHESQLLIERIKEKFTSYSQEWRESQGEQGDQTPGLLDKIENQWRKLDMLINSEIPRKEQGSREQQIRKLSNLRETALKIQNMYINKFGWLSHMKLNIKKEKGLFPNQVIHSGIRKLGGPPEKNPLKNPIPVQEEEEQKESEHKNPTMSQIFRSGYEQDDDPQIRKLQYNLRKDEFEGKEAQEYHTYTSKLSSFFVASLIVLIIVIFLLNYLEIQIDTGLLSHLFEL